MKLSILIFLISSCFNIISCGLVDPNGKDAFSESTAYITIIPADDSGVMAHGAKLCDKS